MFKKKLLKAQYLWRPSSQNEKETIPSEEEIEFQLKEIFRTVLISEERKTQIQNLNNHAKWKLISSYTTFFQSNHNNLKYISYKEISLLLDKLNNKPTIIDLHEIRNWFLRASESDVNIFCVYEGVKLLFKILKEAESTSKITKNFRKQMEILKLIELIAKTPNGPQEILKNKSCFDVLLLNLHWVNIDMTALTLEIITHILWNSNEGQEYLLEALNKFHLEKKTKNRFDIILFMMNKTKNIIMIENWLCFINSMISSCTNENKRLFLKSELLSSGINTVFEKIKFRIATGQYSIENCLFDSIQQQLIDIKYSDEENIAYFTNIKDPTPLPNELKHLYSEDKSGKRVIDLHLLHDFLCRNKLHCSESHQLKENILNDKEAEEEENLNLFDLTNYLKETDSGFFEDRIIGVINQMKAFQNLVTIEKKHQTKLMSLEGFLSEKRDFANIYDLIDQIKENVFERENYDQFLLILQYLIMIPKNDQGDELWDSINEILEKLVSKKENLSPDFFSIKKKDSKTLDMIQKKMGELEQLLTAKEEEIKQHIHDKNELNLHLIELRSTKSNENLHISSSPKQKQELTPPIPPPLIMTPLPPPPPPPPPPPMGLPGLPRIGGGPPPLINLMAKVPLQKEKKKPRVPMRVVNWSGISKIDDIKGSVFEKIDEKQIIINIDALEEDFKEKAVEKKDLNKKPIVLIPEKITIIDPKRGKMFDILLAKLKLSAETIAFSLYSCDENVLTTETLELLIPVIPTDEEIKECKGYTGDKMLLAAPEKLILAMGLIKGFGNRIRGLHFHKIVHNMLDDLRIKVQQQEKIWSNLLEDSRIPILFQYALAYANYLNGVTSRGGMYGFEFDGLEKIVDCRSTKNTKRNLFIFLLEQIKQTKENAIFNEDFLILEYELLSKIPINQLELDLVDIKKGVKCIESAINTYTEEPRDRIKEVLSENYQRLLGETSLFEMQIKNLLELYQKNVRYLCENPKESSDKTAKKLLFMWQNCWSWKKEEERKQRDEIRKKAIAEKKNKTLGLPVELKTPIKRAADNLLKESNLSKVNSKANPEEIIKELHDKRKTKKKTFGITIKTAMVAKMMFKNIKKKMANKENGSEKIQNEMKTEKQEQIMLRELIEGRLQF